MAPSRSASCLGSTGRTGTFARTERRGKAPGEISGSDRGRTARMRPLAPPASSTGSCNPGTRYPWPLIPMAAPAVASQHNFPCRQYTLSRAAAGGRAPRVQSSGGRSLFQPGGPDRTTAEGLLHRWRVIAQERLMGEGTGHIGCHFFSYGLVPTRVRTGARCDFQPGIRPGRKGPRVGQLIRINSSQFQPARGLVHGLQDLGSSRMVRSHRRR